MAIHAAHLPGARRWPLKGIAAALETLAVPQLKQRML